MQAIHVLYLEDNPDHISLVSDCLQVQFPGTHLESVHQIDDVIKCLTNRHYDVILATGALQDGPILPRLKEIAEAAQETPLIVIAGNGEEKSAANAIKRGATDYIVKSRESLELLPYLILRLIKKRRPSAHYDKPVTPVAPEPVSQLLHEIERVSRRVHNIHDHSVPDVSIAALREEVQQLKQLAQELKIQKTLKSKRA